MARRMIRKPQPGQLLSGFNSLEEQEAKLKAREELRLAKRKKVRGIFKFYELPGARLQFNWKKFDKNPIEIYDLIDGEVYEIPLEVAEHLNANCWYPEYGHVPATTTFDAGLAQVKRKIRRTGFSSLEFVDEASLDLSKIPAIRG